MGKIDDFVIKTRNAINMDQKPGQIPSAEKISRGDTILEISRLCNLSELNVLPQALEKRRNDLQKCVDNLKALPSEEKNQYEKFIVEAINKAEQKISEIDEKLNPFQEAA